MNATIADIMVESVVRVQPWTSASEIKSILKDRKIHCVPVVDEEDNPLGIITSADLITYREPATPASAIMSKELLTVPKYSGPHVAARIMRNQRVHHLLVTHEKKLVGIVSSFDLLELVEEHRFVLRNPPPSQTRKARRKEARQG